MGKKSYWKQQIENAVTDQDVTTRSNEAFALLVLENQWERWLDIYIKNEGKMVSKRGRKRSVCESLIPPKYTRGGITFKKQKRNEEENEAKTNEEDGTKTNEEVDAKANKLDGMKGWTSEGILCFNELYDMVTKDRRKHKDFIKGWLEREKEDLFSTQNRKRKDVKELPKARHELFSDNEDSVAETPERKRPATTKVTPFTGQEDEQEDSVTDVDSRV